LEIFYGSHDGLEREFRFFKWFEGGVCATCAPRDQEKSCDSQYEQTLMRGHAFGKHDEQLARIALPVAAVQGDRAGCITLGGWLGAILLFVPSCACNVASDSFPASTWARRLQNLPQSHWPQSSATNFVILSVSDRSTALIVPIERIGPPKL